MYAPYQCTVALPRGNDSPGTLVVVFRTMASVQSHELFAMPKGLFISHNALDYLGQSELRRALKSAVVV